MIKEKLYFVRHGESTGNVWPPAYAKDELNFLSPFGVSQSQTTGLYFKRMNIKFSYVLVSALTRARHTAIVIGHAMNDWQRYYLVDDRLNEFPTLDPTTDTSRVDRSMNDLMSAWTTGNALVVSHYHTMQAIFNWTKVPRSRIESYQGKLVGNAQPFVLDMNEPDKFIRRVDMSNVGTQF